MPRSSRAGASGRTWRARMSRLCRCAGTSRTAVPAEESLPQARSPGSEAEVAAPPTPTPTPAVPADDSDDDPALAELTRLPLSQLIDRGQSAGAPKRELAAAIDSPSPRLAVARLVATVELRAKEPAGPAIGRASASARRAPPKAPPPEEIAAPLVAAAPDPEPTPGPLPEPRFEPEPEPQPGAATLSLVVAPVARQRSGSGGFAQVGGVYQCSVCEFSGSLDGVVAHEQICPAVNSPEQQYSPGHIWECSYNCGFKGDRAAVEAHELICPPARSPEMTTPNATDAPACEKHWAQMNRAEQEAAGVLGWSESSWEDGDGAPMSQLWSAFSAEQLDAATLMGFDETDFSHEQHDAGQQQLLESPAAKPEAPQVDRSEKSHVSFTLEPKPEPVTEPELEPEREPEPSLSPQFSEPRSGPDTLDPPADTIEDTTATPLVGKDKSWDDMKSAEQSAVVNLGWDQALWDLSEEATEAEAALQAKPFLTPWERLGAETAVFCAVFPLKTRPFAKTGSGQNIADREKLNRRRFFSRPFTPTVGSGPRV